jgi:hypothetical protein
MTPNLFRNNPSSWLPVGDTVLKASILDAGVEINNVTNYLSDHFPVYSSWIPVESQNSSGKDKEVERTTLCASAEEYVLEEQERKECFVELFQ